MTKNEINFYGNISRSPINTGDGAQTVVYQGDDRALKVAELRRQLTDLEAKVEQAQELAADRAEIMEVLHLIVDRLDELGSADALSLGTLVKDLEPRLAQLADGKRGGRVHLVAVLQNLVASGIWAALDKAAALELIKGLVPG